jgi:hypothetical protein
MERWSHIGGDNFQEVHAKNPSQAIIIVRVQMVVCFEAAVNAGVGVVVDRRTVRYLVREGPLHTFF